jgi:hypothetical protein
VEAIGLKHAHQVLAIHQILRATKRNKVYRLHHALNLKKRHAAKAPHANPIIKPSIKVFFIFLTL